MYIPLDNEEKKSQQKVKYYFLYFNLFVLFTNIFFYLKEKKESFFNLHNSDLYLFNLSKLYNQKVYQNYIIRNITSKENKKISIFCEDTLNNSIYLRYYINMIKNSNLIIDIKENHPDFLIYDVFGCNHLNEKYNDSVKIAFYSENILPDFSQADYILSQAHIMYLDRYFKYPSFIYRLKQFLNYDVENIKKFSLNKTKTKFCAAVISNKMESLRLEFIKQLNRYKHVDMGGEYLNDAGGKVKDKIKFLSSYKFSLAMENSDGDGYISEKIIDSLLAGTIPIYYGNYLIDEYINPKTFILIKGKKDIQEKIEYIKKIDSDDLLYNSILEEKIFINDNYIDIIRKTENEKRFFLYNNTFKKFFDSPSEDKLWTT